jgi:hypothetical protein
MQNRSDFVTQKQLSRPNYLSYGLHPFSVSRQEYVLYYVSFSFWSIDNKWIKLFVFHSIRPNKMIEIAV